MGRDGIPHEGEGHSRVVPRPVVDRHLVSALGGGGRGEGIGVGELRPGSGVHPTGADRSREDDALQPGQGIAGGDGHGEGAAAGDDTAVSSVGFRLRLNLTHRLIGHHRSSSMPFDHP